MEHQTSDSGSEKGKASLTTATTCTRFYQTRVFKCFIAGAFSGTCTTVLLQPFDLVKTRLQAAMLSKTHRGDGMIKTIVGVVKKEKFFGLWRGMVPSLYRTVPGVGFYFGSLSWLQSQLGTTDPSPLQAISLGAVSRCIADLILLPVTVVKTRFESTAYKYQSTFGALKSIYKLEGRKGLYSGLAATLLRDAPFSGIYLMFYTSFRRIILGENRSLQGSLLGPGINFSCGILSGMVAAVATQPADVVKTHMQLYPKRHSNITSTVQYIVKENGVHGLFKGIAPRCIRRTLMAALAWTVYEEAIVKLGLK
ncbi:mitochondrial glycine transporter A-like [Amphiura filiformis]|uniref:mitochondrial glycine transporter A-like n=1 Tax=Amphiura filiformis TaxID=82378 RepID=UPI003B223BBC